MKTFPTALLLSFALAFSSAYACDYEQSEPPYCSEEILKKSLPYAEIVVANNQDLHDDALTAHYRPIPFSELPESLQDYLFKETDLYHEDLVGAVVEDISDTIRGLKSFWQTTKDLFDDDDDDEQELSDIEDDLSSLNDNSYIHYRGIITRIYEKNDGSEIVLAFRGSATHIIHEGARLVENWIDNIAHHAGFDTASYDFAPQLVAQIKRAYPNTPFICTGISMGAGLAQYAAIVHGMKAYCFNGPDLSSDIELNLKKWQKTLGLEIDPETIHKNIQHIYVHGDALQYAMQWLPLGSKWGDICQVATYKKDETKSKIPGAKYLKRFKERIKRHSADHLVASIEHAIRES